MLLYNIFPVKKNEGFCNMIFGWFFYKAGSGSLKLNGSGSASTK